MSRGPQPTPRDYRMAEQYLLGALNAQASAGYPAGVAAQDFDDAVQAVAEWTAKMRSLRGRVGAALGGEDG